MSNDLRITLFQKTIDLTSWFVTRGQKEDDKYLSPYIIIALVCQEHTKFNMFSVLGEQIKSLGLKH